jgi:hypothetical protein
MSDERLREKQTSSDRQKVRRVIAWADHVRTTPDEEWSREQNVLIDAMQYDE